jgi:hypothetical protein
MLLDGSLYECHGQVWSCARAGSQADEPTVQVGVCTLEKLRECYVFFGGNVSAAKLDAWLAANTPSNDYAKYDPRQSIEWLDQHYRSYGRTISAPRARKMRRRGVTVWRNADSGALEWSPSYERKKAVLLARRAADGGSVSKESVVTMRSVP